MELLVDQHRNSNYEKRDVKDAPPVRHLYDVCLSNSAAGATRRSRPRVGFAELM